LLEGVRKGFGGKNGWEGFVSNFERCGQGDLKALIESVEKDFVGRAGPRNRGGARGVGKEPGDRVKGIVVKLFEALHWVLLKEVRHGSIHWGVRNAITEKLLAGCKAVGAFVSINRKTLAVPSTAKDLEYIALQRKKLKSRDGGKHNGRGGTRLLGGRKWI
jgi:hypothetical protein